ncbi:MAG TPA: SIMPL domain-containing protein [Bacillota bacterium]
MYDENRQQMLNNRSYAHQLSEKVENARVMTVSGKGSIAIEPNRFRVQLDVRTESAQLSEAQKENASMMNNVIQAIVQLGIAQEQIQTASYRIQPRYDYVDGKQLFRHYEVVHAIAVEMTNVQGAGRVIDVAVQHGVNQVSNLEFTLTDASRYYQQALRRALEDARIKAQTIAESMELILHVTPIKIVELTTEPTASVQTLAVKEAGFTTPIEPGQIIIRARVEMQFQYE